MEIVKQRKRRLMSWILAIALCVGIWQSSVYATEGSVSGNDTGENTILPEENVTGGTETENPVATMSTEEESTESDSSMSATSETESSPSGEETTVPYEVTLCFIDEYDKPVTSDDLYGEIAWGVYVGENEKPILWELGGSGIIFQSESDTITAESLTNKLKNDMGTYTYVHNVLGYKDLKYNYISNDAALNLQDAYIEDIYGESDGTEGDTLPIIGKVSKAYVVLGKSVSVTFWEAASSGEGESATEYNQEIVKDNIVGGDVNSKIVSQESSGELSISMPKGSNIEKGFITGWKRLSDDGIPIEDDLAVSGQVYTTAVEELRFEDEIRFLAEYSYQIPENGGDYYLLPNQEYHMEINKFTVNKDGETDGYAYGGDADTPFYISEEGSYSFSISQ